MSKRKDVDVLVIGAGPAGSTAAKWAAKNGANVLLVDKKSEIGTPKRCAEGITDKAVTKLGIEVDERAIARHINGACIISPNNTIASFNHDNVNTNITGIILERKIFDKQLAMDAIRAGVQVMLKTEAKSMKRDVDGSFIVDLWSFESVNTQIKAKIVIAADGPEGRIGYMAGINTKVPQNLMESGFQYEMTNLKMKKSHSIEFYFGSIAPGGYAWIFPKGYDTANVGIDINPAKATKTAKEYLDDFISKNYATSDAQIVEMNVGGNPLCGVFDQIIDDNIMLVGDAAGCVNPITGGGIETAIESGMIAGKIASKAIKKGDCSVNMLKEYDEYITEHIRKPFKRYTKIRDFLYDLNDDDIDEYVKMLSTFTFDNFSMLNLIKEFIKASPRKLLKLRKLL